MKPRFPREWYIPKHATPYAVADMADAAVWLYSEERQGRLIYGALGFHGDAQKPDFHYTFRTEAARKLHVDNFVGCRVTRAQTMARRKEDRKRPHPLQVGDILHTCWGYEQTNVEWFQVRRIIGPHMVEVQEINQSITDAGGFTWNTRPVKDAFAKNSKPLKRRASHDGVVKIDDVRHAFPGASERSATGYA